MPTNSTSSPSAITSGTRRWAEAATWALVGRMGGWGAARPASMRSRFIGHPRQQNGRRGGPAAPMDIVREADQLVEVEAEKSALPTRPGDAAPQLGGAGRVGPGAPGHALAVLDPGGGELDPRLEEVRRHST